MRALALALLLLSAPAAAQQRAEAIDGDTLRVGGQVVRVVGIDTPEMRGDCPEETALALAARDRLAALVEDGALVIPRGLDRYGRVLAVVRDRAGRDVAEVMIGEGHGRRYDGRGPRGPWCP